MVVGWSNDRRPSASSFFSFFLRPASDYRLIFCGQPPIVLIISSLLVSFLDVLHFLRHHFLQRVVTFCLSAVFYFVGFLVASSLFLLHFSPPFFLYAISLSLFFNVYDGRNPMVRRVPRSPYYYFFCYVDLKKTKKPKKKVWMAVESTSTSDLHFIGTRKKPSFFFETTIPHHSCCYWVLPSFRSDFHFIGRRLFPLGAVTGFFTDFFTEFFRYYWVLPSFFFKLSFE